MRNILFLLLLPLFSFSQELSIKGTILDELNETILFKLFVLEILIGFQCVWAKDCNINKNTIKKEVDFLYIT